ncbi:hypothetical protein [Escherichia coli ISC7]|uniref:Uncharacterized protein n=1 Tax=Escherichia coli ISC7 TaxID=1432555 RepID=W1EXS3_ECOLX|nr:hypothetical protein [Escherichia coli ISC7]
MDFLKSQQGKSAKKRQIAEKRPQLYTKSLSLSGVLLILDDDRFHLKGNDKKKIIFLPLFII